MNHLKSAIKYCRQNECESFIILMAMVNGWKGGSLDDILEQDNWSKSSLSSNQRMIRDNYRCLATEIISGHCILTIDQ